MWTRHIEVYMRRIPSAIVIALHTYKNNLYIYTYGAKGSMNPRPANQIWWIAILPNVLLHPHQHLLHVEGCATRSIWSKFGELSKTLATTCQQTVVFCMFYSRTLSIIYYQRFWVCCAGYTKCLTQNCEVFLPAVCVQIIAWIHSLPRHFCQCIQYSVGTSAEQRATRENNGPSMLIISAHETR